MTLVFDPDDPQLLTKIQNLQPTPGYCILVDIVGSTQLKDQQPIEWLRLTCNTFRNTAAFLSGHAPLKSMGDALMYYIAEEQLRATDDAAALQLFSGLSKIAGEQDKNLFAQVKISVVYCQNAFELTFIRGTRDVYGKEIDLAARLLGMASPCEILMNDGFVHQVRANYDSIGNKQQFSQVERILGPWPIMVKGFTNYIDVYKLPHAQTR